MDSEKIANSSELFPSTAGDGRLTAFNEKNVPIIKIIGVGGGGNNAVNHMYADRVPGVSFVNINTDFQALKNSPIETKLVIGDGLGAGNKPEIAKKYAEEAEEKIAKLLDEDTKMVFITAGMGGGTGTGASPVVARVARQSGKLTIGIVTLPFLFEGRAKIYKALDGARELSKNVDALMLINNERLTEVYPDLAFDNAFKKADDTLTNAARSISELISYNAEGDINLDFADVNTTLKDGGTAIISSGYGEGENRMTKAIQNALNSPLLKNRDVQSSRRFLIHIYYANETEHPLTMKETNELRAFMEGFVEDVDVIFGKSVDNSLGDKLRITILASGFTQKNDLPEPQKKSGIFGKTTRKEVETSEKQKEDEIKDLYGSEKIDEQKRKKARQNYILLEKNELDNDILINFIEQNPTYYRNTNLGFRTDWAELRRSQAETGGVDELKVTEPEPPEKEEKSEGGGITINF